VTTQITQQHPDDVVSVLGRRMAYKWVVAIVYVSALFLDILDTTIVNVALFSMGKQFQSDAIEWVVLGYTLSLAVWIPTSGWLGDRFGTKKTFLFALGAFTVGSIACGAAQSIGQLIAFRVLQGLVAGPMMPLSQTLLLGSHPPERAGRALGIWSMTVLLAPICGPLLGGWITDNLHWEWIFYINIPVGLFCAAMTWSIYRKRETAITRAPVDVVGLSLLVIWVAALQIMLDTGRDEDWFESREIVTLAVVAAVGFLFFVAWELTDRHPVVDLRLFANRNFACGVIALSGGFALFSGNVVLLPLWLQQAMGYTATWAGLVLAPVGVIAVMFSPAAGRGIDRGLARTVAVISFFAFAWSFWLRALFTTQADYGTIVIPMLLQGVAGSLFFIAMSAISFSQVAPHQMPLAAGLSNFVRISAGAFGTSIASTAWDVRSQVHRGDLVDGASRPGWSLEEGFFDPLRGAGMGTEQIRGQLERIVDQQALTLGANDIFLFSSIVYLVLILPVLIARPVRPRARR